MNNDNDKCEDKKVSMKDSGNSCNQKTTKIEGVCLRCCNVSVKCYMKNKKSIKKCVSNEQQVNAICEFQENVKIEGVCWRHHFQ